MPGILNARKLGYVEIRNIMRVFRRERKRDDGNRQIPGYSMALVDGSVCTTISLRVGLYTMNQQLPVTTKIDFV